MRPRRCLRLVAVVAILVVSVAAQQAPRPLSHRDYAGWRTIQSPLLSRDGKRAAYGLFPQEGDGEVVVKDLATGKEFRHGAGELPPPPEPDPAAEEEPAPRGVRLAFTADGRFLISSTFPTKAESEQARKEKKPAPKGGLLILDCTTGAAVRIAGVKSFQTPEKAGAFVAYLKEAKANEDKEKEKEDKSKPGEKKQYGTDLTLRDLTKADGGERTFPDVLEYSLSKDGKLLVYAVASKDEASNGVYAVEAAAGAMPRTLLQGKGKYVKLAWNREQGRLAFLSDRHAAVKQPKLKLYLWERGSAAAQEAISVSTAGFRKGFEISERGPLQFSRDGSRLFFGCAPPKPETPAETTADSDKVAADLWHWKDDFIQPMQKIRAPRERNRTYTAVYHIAENKLIQAADESLQTLSPSDDGRFAIGGDDRAYRRMIDFDGRYADQYLVDTATGKRVRVSEKHPGGPLSWAPDGGHAVFFRDKHWHTLRTPDGAVVNVTKAIEANFWDEDDDRPEPPSSYGTAGWAKDGKSVLLYDRYDIWQVPVGGGAARTITNGLGRREKLQFRVIRLDSDEDDKVRGIDIGKPLLLRAENLETRETGFWRTRLDGGDPQKLRMGAVNYRVLSKAKDAGTVLVTASRFDEFPDLQATDTSFEALRKITEANPQKAQLRWGTAELIRYKNSDGVPLQAALYKLEGFDASRRYPLMVYIYERLSQNVHSFVDPRPGTSINISYYVSNGYLVLTPDIVYTVGYPGQSALKCVLPAVQAVVDKGWVNENAIGIQGHSWGGYQIAYMLTQTRRFRAAEAGAPVANMTSAYNGIRWGSGMVRQFQYEKTQSRLGGALWEYPMRFVENSPVFMADRVSTPLLILHDDQDDAVPWYQGIELFMSLRRLGKEAYLFNYNGEKHGLRKRQNQKDYTIRMQQFFDHFLKDGPKPAWMESGIPYLDRDREKERFQAAAK